MIEPMSAPMSARAAAALCGVSERTLRRWIAAGRLPADKQGGAFLVSLEDVRTLAGRQSGHAADSAAAPDMSAASHTELSDLADTSAADTPQHTAELVRLLAQLHAEVSAAKDETREYAAAAAMWQERAGSLADRLALTESKLLALEAPAPSERPGAGQPAPEAPDPEISAPSPWPAPIPPTTNTAAWWHRWWPLVPWLLLVVILGGAAVVGQYGGGFH